MKRLGVEDVREFTSRYNIAPGTIIPAIRAKSDGTREEVGLQWGLVPRWSKYAKSGARLANARAEGIAAKPAFRDALRQRRCVVPASGFYEWQTIGRIKHPWYFRFRDESPFVFAALWESWRSQDGVELETCSLITTAPNDAVQSIHDRMPVILPDEKIGEWMDDANDDPTKLLPLLVPVPDGLMDGTPVSPRVNSVRNEGPECLERAEPPSPTAPAPAGEDSQLSLGLG